jgi:hypothetical protein
MAKAAWTCLLLAALVGLGGCSDDKDKGNGGTTDGGTTSAKPGFGDDTRRPAGTAFNLPSGVRAEGTLVGTDDDGNCAQPRLETVGAGFLVRACLPVRNDTDAGVPLVIPAGLTLVATTQEFQNGIILVGGTAVVQPSGGGDAGVDAGTVTGTQYLALHAWCLNKNRSGSEPRARYELGPVTNNAQVLELISLIQGKDIAGDGSKVEVVQEALWHITDGTGLTADDREALKDL